jgi:hypothetical protein
LLVFRLGVSVSHIPFSEVVDMPVEIIMVVGCAVGLMLLVWLAIAAHDQSVSKRAIKTYERQRAADKSKADREAKFAKLVELLEEHDDTQVEKALKAAGRKFRLVDQINFESGAGLTSPSRDTDFVVRTAVCVVAIVFIAWVVARTMTR